MDAQAQKRKEEKAAWLRELIVVKRLDPKVLLEFAQEIKHHS
jgi:hypothetical protein